MESTAPAFVHLPTEKNFVTLMTDFVGNNQPSAVTHLIDKVKDPELALFSLGRHNYCSIYPKFINDVATFDGVLSKQGMECYNEIIQALKNREEDEEVLANCYPDILEDTFSSFNNICLIKPSGVRSSPMIFLETNVENIKSERPEICGWCVSAQGKLRIMDQSTTDKVRVFLKEKCRSNLGSLFEINEHRYKENKEYRSKLRNSGIVFNENDLDINDEHDIY